MNYQKTFLEWEVLRIVVTTKEIIPIDKVSKIYYLRFVYDKKIRSVRIYPSYNVTILIRKC